MNLILIRPRVIDIRQVQLFISKSASFCEPVMQIYYVVYCHRYQTYYAVLWGKKNPV